MNGVKKKRAIIGFRSITLMPVTENTAASYKAAGTPIVVPFAGSMTRTVKESTQDLYYEDELYANVKEVMGEDVEIRIGDADLKTLATLGLGKWDETTQTLEADYSVSGKEYSLRCRTATIDEELPYFFRWRLFTITGIKFDNFNTKGSNISVCEAIITGTLSRPLCPSVKAFTITQVDNEMTNAATAAAVLVNPETLPAGAEG